MRPKNLLIVFLIACCSCKQINTAFQEKDTERKFSPKTDTLIASFMSCTECKDLFIHQGTLTVPVNSEFAGARDIYITGDFPIKLIDMSSFSYDPFLTFKIIGRVVLDSAALSGAAPLFHVDSWEKFYFDWHVWSDATNPEVYEERAKMVDGLTKYFKLKGKPLEELWFLGNPDVVAENAIGYRLAKGKIIQLKFSADSIVTEVNLIPAL